MACVCERGVPEVKKGKKEGNGFGLDFEKQTRKRKAPLRSDIRIMTWRALPVSHLFLKGCHSSNGVSCQNPECFELSPPEGELSKLEGELLKVGEEYSKPGDVWAGVYAGGASIWKSGLVPEDVTLEEVCWAPPHILRKKSAGAPPHILLGSEYFEPPSPPEEDGTLQGRRSERPLKKIAQPGNSLFPERKMDS